MPSIYLTLLLSPAPASEEDAAEASAEQ